MTALFTRKDYDALPEDFAAQLVDGVLVREPTPSLDHQGAQSRILWALQQVLGPDRVFAAPVSVYVDQLNVFEPDIAVVSEPPAPGAKTVGTPLLVFEIASPSTRAHDRDVKARRYLALGVREVWLVDPMERSIEVVDVDETCRYEDAERAVSGVLRAFGLVPDELFRPRGSKGDH